MAAKKYTQSFIFHSLSQKISHQYLSSWAKLYHERQKVFCNLEGYVVQGSNSLFSAEDQEFMIELVRTEFKCSLTRCVSNYMTTWEGSMESTPLQQTWFKNCQKAYVHAELLINPASALKTCCCHSQGPEMEQLHPNTRWILAMTVTNLTVTAKELEHFINCLTSINTPKSTQFWLWIMPPFTMSHELAALPRNWCLTELLATLLSQTQPY
ncbi:hypothetical protein VP01_496g14 [Puccinia sorghi]|uniref:Uncharacterized protein n=1 Tax=Puccinia sorghi TaxID=27349 RepID=A0A0L6UNV5_9BASI|nr:hypothetical protein VP01_496g14 [Puccinia sorghi]